MLSCITINFIIYYVVMYHHNYYHLSCCHVSLSLLSFILLSCITSTILIYDVFIYHHQFYHLSCCFISPSLSSSIVAELNSNDTWVWTRSRKPVVDPYSFTEGQCRAFEGWIGECKAQWIPTDSPDYKGAPMRM